EPGAAPRCAPRARPARQAARRALTRPADGVRPLRDRRDDHDRHRIRPGSARGHGRLSLAARARGVRAPLAARAGGARREGRWTMSPRRLSEAGDTFGAELLRAARSDAPPEGSDERALAALGLAALGTTSLLASGWSRHWLLK